MKTARRSFFGNSAFSFYALGRPHQVYVGSAHLSTNTYNSTGTLAQTTFGNGGIIDSVGTKVVEYKYDAWGKPISKTSSLASTLGTLNPFRYRSYIWDEETQVFYLSSRYYSPQRSRFINGDWSLGEIKGILKKFFLYMYKQSDMSF